MYYLELQVPVKYAGSSAASQEMQSMSSAAPVAAVHEPRTARGQRTGVRARRGTPEELLVTAERLIATNGVDTVSLRQIAGEAGCRNPSVIHYHFGSRIGLLRAIVELRAPWIDRRLRQLLDDLTSEHRQYDLRGVVEAMARPLLELDESSHYLAFLARLYARPEMEDAFASMVGSTHSIPLLQERLRVALPHVPSDVRLQRLQMAADLAVTTIANRPAREASGSTPPLPSEQFAQLLFDAMVGLLAAPHTTAPPETQASLAGVDRT